MGGACCVPRLPVLDTFTETIAFAQPWPTANENEAARVGVLPEEIVAICSAVTRDTNDPRIVRGES